MILANSINVDPLSYTTNYLAGDWQAMQRAAKAIRSLSKYSGDYAREISSAVDETDGNWKGNAAQSSPSRAKPNSSDCAKNRRHWSPLPPASRSRLLPDRRQRLLPPPTSIPAPANPTATGS